MVRTTHSPGLISAHDPLTWLYLCCTPMCARQQRRAQASTGMAKLLRISTEAAGSQRSSDRTERKEDYTPRDPLWWHA